MPAYTAISSSCFFSSLSFIFLLMLSISALVSAMRLWRRLLVSIFLNVTLHTKVKMYWYGATEAIVCELNLSTINVIDTVP